MADTTPLPGGDRNRARVLLALETWGHCQNVAHRIYNTRPPTALYAQRAARLLFMCAAHESGFRFRRQQGVSDGVGAYGVMQVELATAQYVIQWAEDRPALLERCNAVLGLNIHRLSRDDLARILQHEDGDMLGAVLARLKFFTIPAAIPWGVRGQAIYAKKWYNTAAGKAKASDYYQAYVLWHTTICDAQAVMGDAP